MRKIYILIELLRVPYALVQAKWLELLYAHSVQCSGSSISAANEATLPEGAATHCNAFLWGQGHWHFQVTFPQSYFYFSPFLSSSKIFPSSFMLLQINSEKGLRVTEWLISFFSTLLPISSKVTVPKKWALMGNWGQGKWGLYLAISLAVRTAAEWALKSP